MKLPDIDVKEAESKAKSVWKKYKVWIIVGAVVLLVLAIKFGAPGVGYEFSS